MIAIHLKPTINPQPLELARGVFLPAWQTPTCPSNAPLILISTLVTPCSCFFPLPPVFFPHLSSYQVLYNGLKSWNLAVNKTKPLPLWSLCSIREDRP